MENEWQVLVAELEKLANQVGVSLPPLPQPPPDGPVGPEWADPWLIEARRLGWLTDWVRKAAKAEAKEKGK